MAQTPKSLFRHKSVERLSSPEKLDELMEVISPKGWWWVGSLAFVSVSILIWSIFGRIPMTVMGEGVLVYLNRVSDMETIAAGSVSQIKVKLSQTVKKGDVLAIVDQPELKQQLAQKEQQLQNLLAQFRRENQLQTIENDQQRQMLRRQLNNYQQQIADATRFADLLKTKNLTAILAQKSDLLTQIQQLQTTGVQTLKTNQTAIVAQRQSLNEQLGKAQEMLANLQKLYAKQKELLDKELITANIVLQTEQQILQIFDQNSSIQANLKQLDAQESQLQQAQLNNSNKISELGNQVQQLEIQVTQTEQSFLEAQRKIDELKSQVIDTQSQLTQIDLTTRKTLDDQTNQRLSLVDEINQLKLKLQQNGQILSDFSGEIIDIQVGIGQIVSPGQPIASILRAGDQEQLSSLSFFSIGDGKQVQPGMRAQITPSSVQKKDYGGIKGEVLSVAAFPISTEEAIVTIGDRALAQALTANNKTIAIRSELKTDPSTFSGYRWSSRQGPEQKITQGTTTLTQITVDERAPISFVLPFLRSVTGLD